MMSESVQLQFNYVVHVRSTEAAGLEVIILGTSTFSDNSKNSLAPSSRDHLKPLEGYYTNQKASPRRGT